MFGDFDMFEYQGQDPTYALNNTTGEWEPNDPSPTELEHDTYGMLIYMCLQALFFSTGIGMQVLLISLLTGLLGNNYDRNKDRARVLFLQARARMLLDQECRPWVALTKILHKWVSEHSVSLTTTERSDNDVKEDSFQEKAKNISRRSMRCAQLLEQALRPLKIIMKPPPTPFRQDLYNRFVFRFVWAPVQRFPPIACVMLPLAVVLGPLSLVVAVVLFLVALFLCPIFNVKGLSYAINLFLG